MKKAVMSNVRDPENRSKKKRCVCGSHSRKAKNSKRNKKRRIKFGLNIAAMEISNQKYYEQTLEGMATKHERDIEKMLKGEYEDLPSFLRKR